MGIASIANQGLARQIVEKELSEAQIVGIAAGYVERVKLETKQEWTPGLQQWVVAKAKKYAREHNLI